MERILQKSGFSSDNVTDEQYQQGVCDGESVEEAATAASGGAQASGRAGLRRSRTPGSRALCPPAREALAELRPRSRGRARRPRPAPTPRRLSCTVTGGTKNFRHSSYCKEMWTPGLRSPQVMDGFSPLAESKPAQLQNVACVTR
ncbi:Oral-Facial-Digital Syndrome 1 Protein [Manis pentadactyla]|nr:Oral-Facial-Digital Syndrome 1 Protein [Manis pentadactyla]